MSSTERLMVELIRRGATLLKEPCPKCGGLMVRYRGKNVCPACLKVGSIEEIERLFIPKESLEAIVVETAERRVLQLIKDLEAPSSTEREREIVSLILLYYRLLNEIKKYKEEGGKR